MEELELQEKPGLITGWWDKIKGRRQEEEDGQEAEAPVQEVTQRKYNLQTSYKYHVTVRRQIVAFDDAFAAAASFKRGEQQVLNLCGTDPVLRQRIVDFMSGVSYAQEGEMQEIGDNIYMVVPAHAYVEVAPAAVRPSATPVGSSGNSAWN